MMDRKYTTIDLCAGIGGIRTGFTMTGGFENLLSAEIDADARATYAHLYGEQPEGDLTTRDFKKKATSLGFDVLLAGFPCQTFSSMGLKKGFDDPDKGIIFRHITDIISRCKKRPKAIFLENVENLLVHDHGHTINCILSEIKLLRYKVVGRLSSQPKNDDVDEWSGCRRAFLRNSKDFGVPQNRPRVYIMAFDEDYFGDALNQIKDLELPMSAVGPGWKDVDEVLEPDVEKVGDRYYISSGYWQTLRDHRARHAGSSTKKHNGFGFVVVNDEQHRHKGRKLACTIMATGGSGKERNLVRQPKPKQNTTEIIKGLGKRSPLNAEGIRMMMPEEWGRVQGFVEYGKFMHKEKGIVHEFSFPEGMSDAQKYKQFGNSVTIPVIEAMADFMLQCFRKMEPLVARRMILEFVKRIRMVTLPMLVDQLHLRQQVCSEALKRLVEERMLYKRGNGRETCHTRYSGV